MEWHGQFCKEICTAFPWRPHIHRFLLQADLGEVYVGQRTSRTQLRDGRLCPILRNDALDSALRIQRRKPQNEPRDRDGEMRGDQMLEGDFPSVFRRAARGAYFCVGPMEEMESDGVIRRTRDSGYESVARCNKTVTLPLHGRLDYTVSAWSTLDA